MPHGPADPVIFKALQQTLWRFGNGVQWRMGSHPEPWVQVGLNPQPLPPRTLFFAAIADQVIDRALLVQEMADALQSQGESRGIIIVSGYISKFADDFELCPPIPWPFPWPRPHWLPAQPGGADLIVTGVQLDRAASQTVDGQLKQSLADAGAKLTQAGVAMLQ